MVEYVKKGMSSGTAKAALGFGIGGAALGLLNGGGSLLGFGRPYGAPFAVDGGCGYPGGGFITVRETALAAENAQLKAEKYADERVRCETDPLVNRICALETAAAVNAARDHDYRRYVDSEFVHQPKTKMHNSVIVTQPCDCCCDD